MNMFFIFKPKDFIEIKDSSKAKNQKKARKIPTNTLLFWLFFQTFPSSLANTRVLRVFRETTVSQHVSLRSGSSAIVSPFKTYAFTL
jgi:hypothetical protein